jgi:hypothetical protein
MNIGKIIIIDIKPTRFVKLFDTSKSNEIFRPTFNTNTHPFLLPFNNREIIKKCATVIPGPFESNLNVNSAMILYQKRC